MEDSFTDLIKQGEKTFRAIKTVLENEEMNNLFLSEMGCVVPPPKDRTEKDDTGEDNTGEEETGKEKSIDTSNLLSSIFDIRKQIRSQISDSEMDKKDIKLKEFLSKIVDGDDLQEAKDAAKELLKDSTNEPWMNEFIDHCLMERSI